MANGATYHAQYQFQGRLEAPLVELQGAELARWLTAHPDDYAVIYVKDTSELATIAARFKQVYCGKAVELVDARTEATLLAVPVK